MLQEVAWKEFEKCIWFKKYQRGTEDIIETPDRYKMTHPIASVSERNK